MSDEVPKELLEQCLRTLESRPQWWTSYSNSRQNALVICHASRIETEKEELIELQRSIAKSSLKLNNGLQEALRNAIAQSAQQQSFIHALQSLQGKIVTDMEATDSVFKRTFGKFLREIEAGIWSLQDSISEALSNVRAGTGVLEGVQFEQLNELKHVLKFQPGYPELIYSSWSTSTGSTECTSRCND